MEKIAYSTFPRKELELFYILTRIFVTIRELITLLKIAFAKLYKFSDKFGFLY
jgi:hypothetical protein